MRTIAHISDLHFGTIDPPVAAALIRELQENRPDLIVISGDLTQRARTRQYRAAMAFLGQLAVPQLIVPGNHDVPLWNLFARFAQPLRNFRRFAGPDLTPLYSDDELLVVGVNTARRFTWRLGGFWKDGRISPAAMAAAEEAASHASPGAMKVLVTHHPFVPPPGCRPHGMVHGGAAALVGLERAGFDLLLAGHLHVGYSGDVRTHFEACQRSILSIQAGTATSTRRRHGEPNAYNLIRADAAARRVEIDVRTWRGQRFETREAILFVRHPDGWARG